MHRLWLLLLLTTPTWAQTLVNRPQSSFLSGQVSPLLSGRLDLPTTQYGCRELTNVQVIDVGAVTRRPGTIYVATALGAAYLYPFVYSEEDAYALEFTSGLLRFYRDTGIVLNGATPYSIATPYAAADIDTLQFYQSSDTAYIVSTTGTYSPRKLVRSGHTSWTLTDCSTLFDDGPFRTENSTTTTIAPSGLTGSVTLIADGNIFDVVGHAGALWRIDHVMPTQADATTFSGVGDGNDLVAGIGASYAIQFTCTAPSTFAGTIQLQVSYDNGATWVGDYTATNATATTMDANDSWVSDFGQNVLLRVSCTAFTSGSVSYTLEVDSYVHAGVVRISSITDANECTATVLDRLGGTDATTRWAEGAWSDYRGWPTAITGHFGRVVYGRDLTVWFSVVDDYESFANHFAADDEAFSWVASQAEQNPIRWMVGERTQNMLLGTLGKVMELRSLDELSGFTPSNPPKVSSASAVACATLTPVLAETALLFADRTGRHVHELIYDSGQESVTSPDLTQVAGSILGDSSVLQMALQERPWPTLWCVRGDGNLASCYYSHSYGVAAWSTHSSAGGRAQSVAVLPTNGGLDRVWLVVQRTVNGSTAYYVEYLADIDVDEGLRFVDSSLSWDGGDAASIAAISKANPGVVRLASWPTGLSDGDNVRIESVAGMTQINDQVLVADDCNAGALTLTLDTLAGANFNTMSYSTYTSDGTLTIVEDTFAGLSHLEGESVAVLADGVSVGTETVSGGLVSLADYYNEVYIGLPYTSTVMPLEVDLMTGAGTTQFQFKKIVALLLNVYESTGIKYGVNAETLKNVIWTRSPGGSITAPGTRHTGAYVLDLMTGARQEAMYTVIQEEPYPMTLRGLVPLFEVER